MERYITKKLLTWKDADRRKPLVLRGARQVGKTWLVENALGTHFANVVKIDFEARKDLHRYFKDNLEPDEIIKGLELTGGRIIPGQTLLFFDEIQACPNAITALRYFYEKKPELHVVAAGSLLEFAFSDTSVPVGRLQYLHVHPMSFYEYLIALDKFPMAEHVLNFPINASEEHVKSVLNELKNYFFVGGMPEAVKTFRDTGSLLETFSIHSEIVQSYRDDFAKYSPKVDLSCLDEVFLNSAKSVGEQLKYTRLSTGFSYQTAHKAFDVLVKAQLLKKTMACSPSGLPLGATANHRKFKAYLVDIGLLQRICGVPVDTEIACDDLLAIFRGKLAEQFIAQELTAWSGEDLFYWSREAKNSNAEVDFLTTVNGQIYPIEVKAGPAGKLRSLHMLLQKFPKSPQGLVFQSGPAKHLDQQKICFLPLYAVGALFNPDHHLI